MKYTDKQWQIIVSAVVDGVKDDPARFGDVVRAMQYGVTEALREERSHSSDLAVGMSVALGYDKKRIRSTFKRQPQALEAMRRHFGGAAYGQYLEEASEADNDER